MSIEIVKLELIKDGGAQMRVESIRSETVNDYADDMLEGVTFPPVVVYFDGETYWLADGYHRVEAARKIEVEAIKAEIREGTQRDATLHGIGANALHGLRRNQADRRRAVETLLKDPEWSRLSDRKLGELAHVDHKTVGKVRRELTVGNLPTAKREARAVGKFPTSNGNAARTALVAALRAASDEELLAECRRRGIADA